jgi:hypothetical protein
MQGDPTFFPTSVQPAHWVLGDRAILPPVQSPASLMLSEGLPRETQGRERIMRAD